MTSLPMTPSITFQGSPSRLLPIRIIQFGLSGFGVGIWHMGHGQTYWLNNKTWILYKDFHGAAIIIPIYNPIVLMLLTVAQIRCGNATSKARQGWRVQFRMIGLVLADPQNEADRCLFTWRLLHSSFSIMTCFAISIATAWRRGC